MDESLWGMSGMSPSDIERMKASAKEREKRFGATEIAKQLVHEALKQYPRAIPWFVGINDDWTIGHLQHNLSLDKVELRSENFSDRNLQDMCRSLSEKLDREVSPEFLLNYTGYNGEPGRLVVKQFIQAIAALIMSGSKTGEPREDAENLGEAFLSNDECLPAAKVNVARLLPGEQTRHISPKVRVSVLQRDGFRCIFCGRTSQQIQLEVDCKIPLSKGGSDDLSNLQTLCVDCYRGKEDLDL